MKIKLKQEENDFIEQTFGCIDGNYDSKTDGYDSVYFMPLVYVKEANDRGTCIFEMKHITEVNKDDLLMILKCIMLKSELTKLT